jgi:hypothetical protein
MSGDVQNAVPVRLLEPRCGVEFDRKSVIGRVTLSVNHQIYFFVDDLGAVLNR